MAYTKTTWVNNQAPAINADNLNKIEDGIYNSVRYADAQTLTEAQKTQARVNIGSAPDGYGLGGYATQLPGMSCNEAVYNGWYNNHGNDNENCPKNGDVTLSYGTLLVSAKSYTNVMQFYFPAISNFTGYCIRTFDGTTWTPWEWPNPPLALGVEYRTTERYLGKPVYAQIINCGSMPNIGSEKTTSITAFNVGVVTFISGWCTYYGSVIDPNLLGMALSANTSSIRIRNLNREFDSNEVIFTLVKYTKTTD